MDVIDWLLDSDPAIRWQVMRDLADAPEDAVAAERARVAREGWGARNPHPGELHFPVDDGEGKPSRWNTLRAMRVLRWYEKG